MGEPHDLPDTPLEPPEVAISPRERPMGFLDHLEELRWTLVKSAIAFAIFAVLIGVFMRQFNDVLLWPLNHVQANRPEFTLDLGTTSIMEGFSVILQMCFMGGLVMSAPFILFFVGQFVAPALHDREIKLLLPGCAAAFLLFVVGALIAVSVPALSSESWLSKGLGFAALILASVNIFGGFIVTYRMLSMFKKKGR